MTSVFEQGYSRYLKNTFHTQRFVNPIAASSARLHLYRNDQRLAIGTGFFWQSSRGPCLISAWHNFSGLHHTRRTVLDRKNAGMPNRIKVFFLPREPMIFRNMDFSIYNENDEPTWVVHPTCGSYFDIAAAYVKIEEFRPFCVNEIISTESLPLRPPEPIYALGYPQGVSSDGAISIWKAGTVATEPTASYGGLPVFLADIVGREGMSGAPVFRNNHSMAFQNINFHENGKTPFDFVGLYSGRANGRQVSEDSGKSSELGMIWHPKIVAEIAESGVPDEKPEPGKGINDITLHALIEDTEEEL
jgi:hypothetical protein